MVAGEVAVAVAEVAVVAVVAAVVDGPGATATPSATAGGKLLQGTNFPFEKHRNPPILANDACYNWSISHISSHCRSKGR